jgi:kynurenine 3-monooxygenase
MHYLVLFSACAGLVASFVPPSGPVVPRYETNLLVSTESLPLAGLRAAVVGAGPSGLLVAHRLVESGATVEMYEGRKDPRLSGDLEGRAYALGIGLRGRSAIRTIDNALWDAVKARGYESERFTLYIGGFPIRLRDKSTNGSQEPSVLMYQSDLCAALLDELQKRDSTGKLSLHFEQKITSCDLQGKRLSFEDGARSDQFDVIIGCDGVNSAVRASIGSTSAAFVCEKNPLPGEFRVCRIFTVPEKVDPTSVALIIPKSGSTTAFVEPTASGSCLLFAGKDDDPILKPTANLTATEEALQERFPILAGVDFAELARQLADQKSGAASSVRCNTYHYGSIAALCGDAAHATGGVSGQGVNSALVDSIVLGDCLAKHFDPVDRTGSLAKALLQYSQQQVPEGKALYDLSFGPNPRGLLKVRFLVRNVLDTLFKGRFGIGQPPLQTLLTTSPKPFSEVRRDCDRFYDEPFPEQSTFDDMVAKIYD